MRALSIACIVLASTLPVSVSAQCVLSGEATIERVRIAPRGAAPFEIDLEAYDVAVVPLGDGRVRVESATELVWAGTARDRDVDVHLASEVSLGGGAITLGASARLSSPSLPTSGDPRADVELADGAWVRRATMPCAALSLAPVEWSRMEAPGSWPERGDLLPRGRSLRVHAAPSDGPSVRVELASPSSLRLAAIERRGAWIRVRRALASARIVGWVRASEVRVVTEAPLEYEGALSGSGGGCMRGASHTYTGPATLLAGSEIRTAPDGVVWARASGDVEVRAMLGWGAEWGTIESLEGLVLHGDECEGDPPAWVPATALRIPPRSP